MNRALAVGLSLLTLVGLLLFFQGEKNDQTPPNNGSPAHSQASSKIALKGKAIKLIDIPLGPIDQETSPKKAEQLEEKPSLSTGGEKRPVINRDTPWRMTTLVHRWVEGMEKFRSDPNHSLIEAKLELLKVHLNIQGKRFKDVIADLNMSGLGFEIRIDPRVLEYLQENELEISLRLKNISLRDAFNLILSAHPDLAYFIHDNILEVTWEKFLPDDPNEDTPKNYESIPVDRLHNSYRKVLEERRVTMSFKKAPLSDIISFLQDITGLNITVSRDIDTEELLVSYEKRDRILGDTLKAILAEHKLHWIFENETLKIVDQKTADSFWKQLKEIEAKQKTAQEQLESKSTRSLNNATLLQALSFLESEFQIGSSIPAKYQWQGFLQVNKGDSLALICERMALLGVGSWGLQQQQSGNYTVQFWQANPGLLSYCQDLIEAANAQVSQRILYYHKDAFDKILDKATESKRALLQFQEQVLNLQSASQLRIKRKAFLKRIKDVSFHSLNAWLASKADTTYAGLAPDQEILKSYELHSRLGVNNYKARERAEDYIYWVNQTTFEDRHPGLKLLGVGED